MTTAQVITKLREIDRLLTNSMVPAAKLEEIVHSIVKQLLLDIEGAEVA